MNLIIVGVSDRSHFMGHLARAIGTGSVSVLALNHAIILSSHARPDVLDAVMIRKPLAVEPVETFVKLDLGLTEMIKDHHVELKREEVPSWWQSSARSPRLAGRTNTLPRTPKNIRKGEI
ncbi:MAG TPA: hypothetical protein VFA15_01320 [Nitrososphaera sp.]|nr:hypothetical protein [Nitrososphaera sp.]